MYNIIFQDQEEFLYLLNLIKSKRVINTRPNGGEQGWLNAIYLWEKFDIGTEYNVCANVLNLGMHSLMHNATILHFSGKQFKPDYCHVKESLRPLCAKWTGYRQKLP